jgi:hypothetical protein
MKKLLLLLIVIPLTFFGQSNNNLPIIDLDIAIEPEEGDDTPNFDVIPIFRPIGWNKDGEFAYKITKCDDMCGCCIDYICIRSIITDEVIDAIDFGEISDHVNKIDFGEHRHVPYQDSTNKVNLMLSKHKIQKTGFGKLIHSDKVNQYDIILKQNNWMQSRSEYTILIGNNKIGSKRVSEGVVEWPLADLNYIGYFKYPFENRILILFSSVIDGHAETNWHTLHFVGCSLDPKTF